MSVSRGSWAAGSKATTATSAIRFENEGFVVFNIEYRTATDYSNRPGVPWATKRDDILAAVDWARPQASLFGFEPSRCGVYGFSAGGHLAAAVGLSGGGTGGPRDRRGRFDAALPLTLVSDHVTVHRNA